MDISLSQKDASLYTIPLSESKARAWIDSLSVTDFGESTKRVFHGLVDFNRRALSPVTRVRIGERLRPKFDVLETNLQRHLNYRTLPLPKRSQRILELKLSLLLEFAGLYQLAALDMLTRNEGSKRDLQTAIYRVIDYMGLYLLSTYSVYTRTRATIWHDIHHMYLLASERGLDRSKFSGGREGALSIEARYIQINMLALFKPYSLRQEEVMRVARYIESVTHLIKLSREVLPEERLGDFVHAAILNNDEPAVIMPYGDLPHSPTVRVFNMRQVILQMDKLIQQNAESGSGSGLLLSNGLMRNLMKRMFYHLTTVRNRESNRFPKKEKVAVIAGMQGIIEVIRNHRDDQSQKQEEDLLFNTMLYGEASLAAAQDDELQREAQDQEQGIHIWESINSSVGGYGLHWPHADSSTARVGELIALRDTAQDNSAWMLGVVKWMEFVNTQGLYCGVELLSTKMQLLTVSAIENRKINHHLPQEGLMLPSIEGGREDPVLILPAYIFQPGDELRLKLQQREEYVALTVLDVCLGAFAYFRFENINEQRRESDNDFDALWGSL